MWCSISRLPVCLSLAIVVMAGGILSVPHDALAQSAASEVATSTNGLGEINTTATPRQQAWLQASIDQRARLAEKLGDEGTRVFAKAKGYESIFDGTKRALAQGPDQVYRGAAGVVHVFESKGGSGQLGYAYGYAQGTPEWAVESAQQVLRSSKATPAEKLGAEAVLQAAAKGKLQVHVVRTSHVLGEPSLAVLEQSLRSTERSASLARTAINNLARVSVQGTDDVARGIKSAARVAAASSPALKTTAKAAVVVGVAVDATLRVNDGIETEHQFATGKISQEEREVAHAKNAAGMVGGWTGAFAGAKVGAAGGGAAGSFVAPGAGTAVGAAVGGAAGGVAGYFAGEAAAETAAEWVTEKVHASGSTIKDSTKEAWDWTTRKCSSGWETIAGK
jgi:hypothetical protein